MNDEHEGAGAPSDPSHTDTDLIERGEADAVIREEGITVKVAVEGEGDKTSEQLEQEHHEAALRERGLAAQRDVEDAEARVADAKTRLERAERDLKEAEKVAENASSVDGEGGGATKASLKELHEEQIDTGKAPIAPGEEEPVSLDDAAKAKENRGRGFG